MLPLLPLPVCRYKDKLGQKTAGTVTRSRLFDISPVQDSTLGPPRIEPATPPEVTQDESGSSSSSSSSSSYSTGSFGHRRMLLGRNARELLQSNKADVIASFDESFQWPYPTITGDRPPLGLKGTLQRGSARQICDTRMFSFGMVWGPLLPAACGIFEVSLKQPEAPLPCKQ